MNSNKRPEHVGAPELFYDENEARKYTSNSRMIEIQATMTERALELLGLQDDEEPRFILDIGCGSGLSGEALTDNGHYWVGFDISQPMLDVAKEREVEGDVILGDAGQGVAFRPGTFDGAISISTLQWLCNSEKRDQHVPKRLGRLFTSLYAALSRGARAVFQFYPENSAQVELITKQAMKAGFTGGVVVDYPNSSKAKKIFLVLSAGGSYQALPRAIGTDESSQVANTDRRSSGRTADGKPAKKSKDWVLAKKERARKRGRDVRSDTKYTGRKRHGHF